MNRLLYILALLATGCATLQDKIFVGTGTVLGFELGQNPATQMVSARLGYVRNEFAVVPTNGVDVLTELQFKNVTGSGGLYQRMAVGKEAIKSSLFMFAKDTQGNLDPQTADAVSRAVSGIPAANASGTAAKIPLAEAYRTSAERTKYDTVAQSLGYLNYESFLLNTSLTADQVQAMRSALKTSGINVP